MELKNKTVLITGATGLIGSNLVDVLMADGNIKVIIMGRSQKKMANTFPEYVENDNLAIIEHDVANPFPKELGAIDVIFHAAGPMERDIVLNKPVNVILPNIIGSINCMEYARTIESKYGNKVRVVMFSSVTVYSNNTSSDLCVTEDMTNCADRLDSPTIAYSESKRMTEVIARAYCKQYGVDVVIARLSTVYGYTRNIPNTAFYEFIRKAMAGEDIVLYGSGMPRRDNIYIDDAINGLIKVAEAGVAGEAYNISSNGDKGNFAAVDEIAKCIAEQVAKYKGKNEVDVKITIPNSERCAGLKLDNSYLKSIGWNLNLAIEQGIYLTIEMINKR